MKTTTWQEGLLYWAVSFSANPSHVSVWLLFPFLLVYSGLRHFCFFPSLPPILFPSFPLTFIPAGPSRSRQSLNIIVHWPLQSTFLEETTSFWIWLIPCHPQPVLWHCLSAMRKQGSLCENFLLGCLIEMGASGGEFRLTGFVPNLIPLGRRWLPLE